VTAVPRLASNLRALTLLLDSTVPPHRIIRATSVKSAAYGFGDASGTGLGSSAQIGHSLVVRQGVWGELESKESSNFRELLNLVDSLEEGLDSGHLVNCEYFLFTDNSTAEAVYYNGTSSSKLLFELALRLRRMEMRGDFQFHLVHVAGTRMISQCTDGLSRGCFSEGVMQGDSMLRHVPLHLSPLERQPSLLHWIRSWTNNPSLTPLAPSAWYLRGQGMSGSGCGKDWHPVEASETWFLWDLAPAAAEAALEALNESRIKRTHLNHVVLSPRLFTHKWRKRLQKLADLVFELPAGKVVYWPRLEHEPLIIGVVLRFSLCSPWQVKQSPSILGMDRQLREMWEDPDGDLGALLRKFCDIPRVLDAM
jgi:hypothetical protein